MAKPVGYVLSEWVEAAREIFAPDREFPHSVGGGSASENMRATRYGAVQAIVDLSSDLDTFKEELRRTKKSRDMSVELLQEARDRLSMWRARDTERVAQFDLMLGFIEMISKLDSKEGLSPDALWHLVAMASGFKT